MRRRASSWASRSAFFLAAPRCQNCRATRGLSVAYARVMFPGLMVTYPLAVIADVATDGC